MPRPALSLSTIFPFVLAAGLLTANAGAAQGVNELRAEAGSERRNWFNDPFIRLSAAMPACPPPAGPYMTEAERREQAHHRLERGTSCWLAGQCDNSNYYIDDAGIAQAFVQAWQAQAGAAAQEIHSLWLTVQGRLVTVQGCAQTAELAAALRTRLDAMARALPKVQGVSVQVYHEMNGPAPYPVLKSAVAKGEK